MQIIKKQSINIIQRIFREQLLIKVILLFSLFNTSVNAADIIFKDGFDGGFFNLSTQIPENDSVLKEDNLPKIGIEYTYNPLNEATIYIDGVNVTSFAVIEDSSIYFTPKAILNEGFHEVKVGVNDHTIEWRFKTSSPPVLTNMIPSYSVIPEKVIPKIGSDFTDLGSGINLDSIKLKLNGIDVTANSTINSNSIEYIQQEPKTPGRYTVDLSISDNAGNNKNRKWSFVIPNGKPNVEFTSPNYENTVGESIILSAIFEDQNSDIQNELVTLLFDNVDVTHDSTIVYSNNREGVITYEISPILEEGFHTAILFITNESGGSINKSLSLIVRNSAIYTAEIISPDQDTIVKESEMIIRVLTGSNRSGTKEIKIAGVLARRDDENPLIYYRNVKLSEGQNVIPITVEFNDGHVESNEVNIIYIAPPKISITSPNDWQIFGSSTSQSGNSSNLTGKVERPITITGTLNRKVETVEINQQIAKLNTGGTSFQFIDFFLHEGTNLLSITAKDSDNLVSTSHITVYVDQTAPLLTIEGHDKTVVTSSNTIDIRGIVNDAVEGGVNAAETTIVA